MPHCSQYVSAACEEVDDLQLSYLKVSALDTWICGFGTRSNVDLFTLFTASLGPDVAQVCVEPVL